jgi:membrane protein DedA with SNARE-associated domain
MVLSELITLLSAYKYFLLFPLTVVEGPITMVLAGFLVSLGQLDFLLAYVVVVAADLIGDGFYYALGYFGRERFVLRWGHYIGITPERIARLEKHFQRHDGKTLIMSKLAHAVGVVVLVAAGLTRMPFGRFLWYNLLPTLPKALLLLALGFYFGQAYDRIQSYLDYTALGMVLLVLILLLVYFAVKQIGKKYESKLVR